MTDARVLATDALTAVLVPDPLDPSDVVAGAPTTASASLQTSRGVEIGVWEITEGAVTDVEADEVFVVLTGRGEVAFEDGAVVRIGPGSVVRLRAGERTTWTITETLRKIYVLLPEPTPPEEAS